MKLTTFFILISIGCVFASKTYSQTKTLNLKLDNTTVKEVLSEIEEQSEFYFMYNGKLIDAEREVSINIKKQKVEEVLNSLFASTDVNYVIKDRFIVLTNEGDESDVSSALQQKTISGKVTDEQGLPLPGVTVLIKGTTNGTVTNMDGIYSIANIPNDATLQFSFVGMRTQEIVVEGKTTISVKMMADAIGLDEVVAVGYGTQKKVSMTSAVSAMKAEEIQNVSVANASNALVGRMPGVITRQASGTLGEDQTDIYIRGISTMGNSNPLIIIDGIPRGSLNEIDPSAIESYTVLKDAAAVAPYGMGGANGVILITTKSGNKTGKPRFSLNSNIGFQNPAVKPDFANSYEYSSALNQAEINEGVDVADRTYSAEDIDMYKRSVAGDPTVDRDLYPSDDALDYYIEPNAPISKTDFSASGGTEKVQYFTGLNYLYQQANFKENKLNRVGINAKIDLTPTNKTKISLAINGYKQVREGPTAGTGNNGGMYSSARSFIPVTDRIFWEDGRIAQGETGQVPYRNLNSNNQTQDKKALLTKLSFEQEIFDGFKVIGAFAYDYSTQFLKTWTESSVSSYYGMDRTTDPYTFFEIEDNSKPSLSQEQKTWENYTGQGMITYDKQIDKHSISVLGVFEARKKNYNVFAASRSNYAMPIDELNFGSPDKNFQGNSGNSSEGSQVGYVYRLSYNYAQKYLFETAGRYDGHYFFAPDMKYGFFPSVSLGWRISEESFMQGLDNLDNLKLRTSLGQSGNLAGGPNQYSSSLTIYGNSFPMGSASTQGVYAQLEGNPNITWEVATKFNVGTDFTMFGGMLSGEIDYFYEKRDNMLLEPTALVPKEYGIDLGEVNAGKMKSQGIEFMLSGHKTFDNGIHVGLSGNFTYAKNKVTEMYESPATRDDPIRMRTGHPLGTRFGLVSEGLWQIEDDINGDGIINAEDGVPEPKLGGVVRPGNIRYKDVNGDGEITLEDEARISSPTIPGISYSISPEVSWKGFDFSFMLYGTGNVATYVGSGYFSAGFGANNFQSHATDTWTPENPGAKFPKINYLETVPNDGNTHNNSYNTINAAYLRLKFMELGYTLPKAWTERIKLGSVRFYTSGVNLLTWSDVLDYNLDPESTTDAWRGWYHPQQKTITFGININF